MEPKEGYIIIESLNDCEPYRFRGERFYAPVNYGHKYSYLYLHENCGMDMRFKEYKNTSSGRTNFRVISTYTITNNYEIY